MEGMGCGMTRNGAGPCWDVLKIVVMNIDIVELYILMHADYQDDSVYSAVAFTIEIKHAYAPASHLIWYHPTFSHYLLNGDIKSITQVVVA